MGWGCVAAMVSLATVGNAPHGLAGRLANPNAAGKAPPEVVADCRANPAEAEGQAELAR
jgi:valyl-tRNA synthetase